MRPSVTGAPLPPRPTEPNWWQLVLGGGVYVTTPSPSPPVITSQPTNLQTVLAGTYAGFNVGVFGAAPISYQWQKNGINLIDAGNLQGSATSILTLNNPTAADAGVYSVFVTNAFGLAESDEAILEVLVSPPVITLQPTDQTIAPGLPVSFSVSATGDLPLLYQWRRNGMSLSDGGNFSGTSTPTLNLASVSAASCGTYSAVVSNSAGANVSASAVLALIPGFTLTSAPKTNWGCIASSAAGTKLVVMAPGGGANFLGSVYSSDNSGLTWTRRSAPNGLAWQSVASSADGSKLVAAAGGFSIYTSRDSGFTWTQTSAPATNWTSVASSADGTKLVAVSEGNYYDGSYPGVIYTSTNSGFAWTSNNVPFIAWASVASSADGSKLVAAEGYGGGGIYTSTNSGFTWTQRSAPVEGWAAVASSADGSRLVAAAGPNNGVIYTSTDSGFTWNQANVPYSESRSVASSADGSTLAAAGYSGIVSISVDAGATWASMAVPATSVACSADGAKLVMAGNYYGLYTWQTTLTPSLGIAPSSTNAVLSWIIPSLPFALQQNLDLTTTNWTNVTNTPVLNLSNLQNQLTVPLPAAGPQRFYRLVLSP